MKQIRPLKYLCPKCKKRYMYKDGYRKTADGVRKQRWACVTSDSDSRKTYCYTTVNPTAPARGQNGEPTNVKPRKQFKRKIDVRQTLVFTAAQNATPTHQGFWDTLTKAFCPDQKANLCVIPLRYKNPTSIFTDKQEGDEHWLHDVVAGELIEQGIDITNYTRCGYGDGTWTGLLDRKARKYLYEQRKKLNDNLVVVGDVKIQPTAADPLTSMESLTHGESGIFGHTKLRMKTVATPQNKYPKVLTTTGACTVPNYTDSKAGKKGDFHHVLGAVVVQIESPTKFHLHQINARKSDGAFIFKDKAYYPDGTVEKAGRCKAIIFGDAHYRFVNKDVVRATFKKGGLVDVLNPEVLVWHDLLDCYFGNPHHVGNPFIDIAKRRSKYHLGRNEVEETVAWLCKYGVGRKNIVVASNHDDMFARWIIREDWKDHPENAEFYLETALQMARTAEIGEGGAEYQDPFAYWIDRLVPKSVDVRALKRNESFSVGGIMLDNHGDMGPSGARGTIKNLSQIGAKVISGHGHAPGIQDGHTRVGTMTGILEYAKGPNNWLNTHCSIDAFDKRHLHTCVDGKFWL